MPLTKEEKALAARLVRSRRITRSTSGPEGLVLRDWLAGQAPNVHDHAVQMLGGALDMTNANQRTAYFRLVARLSYLYADAMLGERERTAP